MVLSKIVPILRAWRSILANNAGSICKDISFTKKILSSEISVYPEKFAFWQKIPQNGQKILNFEIFFSQRIYCCFWKHHISEPKYCFYSKMIHVCRFVLDFFLVQKNIICFLFEKHFFCHQKMTKFCSKKNFFFLKIT